MSLVKRNEFEDLKERVSHIEAFLKIPELSPPPLHIPYTIVFEQEKFVEYNEHPNTSEIYKYLKNDYYIFVRI